MNKFNYKVADEAIALISDPEFSLQNDTMRKHRAVAFFIAMASPLTPMGVSGAAYCKQLDGLFLDGVLVHRSGVSVGVAFLSDPSATIRPGCNNSGVDGDPWPVPSRGRWINVRNSMVPDEVRTIVVKKANAALRAAVPEVEKAARQCEQDIQARHAHADSERDAMIAAWIGREEEDDA
jgi:hypothetical protein